MLVQRNVKDFIPIVKIKVLPLVAARAEIQTRAGFSGLRSQSENAGQLPFSHPRRSSIMLPLQMFHPQAAQNPHSACWTKRGKIGGFVGLNSRASIR